MFYILNFYIRNTCLLADPVRFKNEQIAAIKYARKYKRTFKYLNS